MESKIKFCLNVNDYLYNQVINKYASLFMNRLMNEVDEYKRLSFLMSKELLRPVFGIQSKEIEQIYLISLSGALVLFWPFIMHDKVANEIYLLTTWQDFDAKKMFDKFFIIAKESKAFEQTRYFYDDLLLSHLEKDERYYKRLKKVYMAFLEEMKLFEESNGYSYETTYKFFTPYEFVYRSDTSYTTLGIYWGSIVNHSKIENLSDYNSALAKAIDPKLQNILRSNGIRLHKYYYLQAPWDPSAIETLFEHGKNRERDLFFETINKFQRLKKTERRANG